jgi:hypothetical protein
MKQKKSFFFVLPLLLPIQSTFGGTVEPLDFSQLVAQTELAVEATVVDIQVFEGGFSKPAGPGKESTAPVEETDVDQADVESASDPADQDPLALPQPESVVTEGGSMLFTDVTLAVDQALFGGAAGDEITIRLAGGSNGQVRVTVAGMPQFELDARYILFLRPGFENYADPITGIDQGFFQIVPSPDGAQDVLLNASGDIVTGVQNDRIAVRVNPEKIGVTRLQLGPPPEPESGVVLSYGTSSAVAGFYDEQIPPMPVDDFIAQVAAAKGEMQ